MKNSSDLIGQQFLISGRVQGVFYRRFAKKTAEELGITGWVRNLDDGSVEVHAFATASALTAYHAKLLQGPAAANVKNILVQDIEWKPHSSFEVR